MRKSGFVFGKRVFYDSITLVSTKDNTDGRIIAFVHKLPGIVVYIHLHLSNILMGQLSHFEVNQHKAFQNVVVEHQINVEVLTVQCEPLLPSHKRKASAQFQKELLQVINQCLLQIAFKHMGVWLDLQELHNIGAFDDLLIFRLRLGGLNLSGNGGLCPDWKAAADNTWCEPAAPTDGHSMQILHIPQYKKPVPFHRRSA